MLDRFDDEFVVTGYVEEGATGPRVAELNQRLTAEGVLRPGEKSEKFRNTRGCPCRNQLQMQFCSKEKPEPGYGERGASFGRIPLILESQGHENRKLTK